MKTFRICAILSVSIVIFIHPTEVSRGCWGGDEEDRSNTSYFFDQRLVNATEYEPLLFTWRALYSNQWYDIDSNRRAWNVDEWRHHFHDVPSGADIDDVVYNYPVVLLDSIYSSLKSPDFRMNDTGITHNSLIQYWRAQKDASGLADVDYLRFVRACEPYVNTDPYEWSEDKEKRIKESADSVDSLMTAGRDGCRSAGNNFLRLRYAYQIVRLAHYYERFDEAVGVYDSLIAPIKSSSIIKGWAFSNRAGALFSLQRYAEAAHDFSVVFSQTPTRRLEAYRSFRIENDSIWAESFKLCRSADEKITMLFLRGIHPSSKALEEMQKIYEIRPSCEELDVLLGREITKMEDALSSNPDAARDPDAEPLINNPDLKNYIIQLEDFAGKAATRKNVRNPLLWRLAEGYFTYLSGNTDGALKIYRKLEGKDTSERFDSQLDVMETAAKVSLVKQLDIAAEQSLFTHVLKTGNQNLLTFCVTRFGNIAMEQGDEVKSYLAFHNYTDQTIHPNMPFVDKLIAFASRNDKTPFEKYILGKTYDRESGSTDFDVNIGVLPTLLEEKGTILLSEHKLREADEVFHQLGNHGTNPLPANPFAGNIRDCRACNDSNHTYEVFDKVDLTERLIAIEDSLAAGQGDSARLHLLLGNAYYNMTYFGNCSEVIDYSRQSEYFEYTDRSSVTAYVDCSRAWDHYAAGMEIAEARGDSELAAECCFMASKCEQNNYYISGEHDENGKIKDMFYRDNFRRMMSHYSRTEYYKEALRECKYFNAFVGRHAKD